MLFPAGYFSLNSPIDNFSAELEAARACPCLEAYLFNFDEYASGGLAFNRDPHELAVGTWTVIEAGDGQASELVAADDPARFYRALSDVACCLP